MMPTWLVLVAALAAYQPAPTLTTGATEQDYLDMLPPLRGFLARRMMFGARAWP